MSTLSDDWYEESSPNLAATLDPNKDDVLEDSGTNHSDGSDETNVLFTNCSLPTPFFSYETYNVVTATICMLYLFFGVFCTFFGYRCFKATMFLTGFIFGSLVVYLICLEEKEKEILPMWANTLIAVSAGILFGLITLLVQYVGLFMLGFHGGLIIGILILCIIELVDPLSSPDSPWVSLLILLFFGLVMALCNLYLQKSLTIFHAALYGGAVITTGLDYFVEHSVMLMWVWDRVRVKESKPICWFSWAIVATWPLTFLLGIFIQIWLTYGGTYHEEQFPPLRRQKKHESREERKQRKYRYLYQVRTCHGDVISQPIANKYVTQIDESQA